MLREEQLVRWTDFYNSARDNPALDDRITVLIQLAAALGLGCDP